MPTLRSFFKRLVHSSSPSSHQTNSSHYPTPVHLLPKWVDPYFNPKVFQRLSPVHHLILDYLFLLEPALIVSLSNALYDKYIPILYHDITMRPYAFSGLFRTYSRGCADDNNTIRAYKFTEVLHLMDTSNSFQISTVTCGDQPVFVPHSNLFENVKKIDLGWEVYLAQGDESLYWMYIDFASKLGEQLKEGVVDDLIVEIKDGSRMVDHRKLIRQYEQAVKPKAITFLVTQSFKPNDANKRTNNSLCVNMIPIDLKYTQIVRFLIPKTLGMYDHICFTYQIKVLYQDWKKLKDQNHLFDTKLKIEYYLIAAENVKEMVIRDFQTEQRWDLLSWMGEKVEYKELGELEGDLRWSKLWEGAKNDE
ncbi:hypothetical protein V866_007835 [Kwoniella sp. B9012]